MSTLRIEYAFLLTYLLLLYIYFIYKVPWFELLKWVYMYQLIKNPTERQSVNILDGLSLST